MYLIFFKMMHTTSYKSNYSASYMHYKHKYVNKLVTYLNNVNNCIKLMHPESVVYLELPIAIELGVHS